jgi:hypothetical protein
MFVKTAEEVLGFKNPTRKNWLSEENRREEEDQR